MLVLKITFLWALLSFVLLESTPPFYASSDCSLLLGLDTWPLSWFGSSHGTFLPSSPSLEAPQCADSWLSAVRARQTDSMAAGCSWKDATVARDVSVAGRT